LSQESEQEAFVDSSNAYVEIYGLATSNSKTPFWMHANQYGTVPNSGSLGSIRAGLANLWNVSSQTNGNLRVGIGFEAVGNAGKTNHFLLPQAYGNVRFKNWELFIGRKKQHVGLADSTLSSGSYAWSGNSLPIPKIQIGTMRFVNLPFTNGWLSFNAFYSDGLFEKGRPYTNDLKLHQKAFYLKIGNKNSRLTLLGGFNHQVQWGGKTSVQTENGQMPTGFKNYIRAVTGKRYPSGPGITQFDYENRIGNHLGTIDLGLEYYGYEYRWFLYRQNIYEDGSLIKLTNIMDGLNGVSIKKQNSYGAEFEVTEMVFEVLYTKSQGGSTWIKGQNLGRDNYFNNQQVLDGWSYFDRTIGTPFITPSSDTQGTRPEYQFTNNNRVMALHAGLKGTLFQDIIWLTKLSYSNNSGTYELPFSPSANQFSGLLTLQTDLKLFGGSTITGSFAGDSGKLYANNFGFSLALRKNISLN